MDAKPVKPALHRIKALRKAVAPAEPHVY